MHLHTIMSETKQDPEDFEAAAREIVVDLIDGLFKGNELLLRELERENMLLKGELLQIKYTFETVEKDREEKVKGMTSKI